MRDEEHLQGPVQPAGILEIVKTVLMMPIRGILRLVGVRGSGTPIQYPEPASPGSGK